MEERRKEFTASLLRDFSIFFAVLFFTCVVGIVELLPEFEKINGILSWICISTIYFGLLTGVVFSIQRCFWLYEQNKRFAGALGFNFPEIEPFDSFGKIIEYPLITGVLLTFFVLYLVKVGLLR